MTTTDSRAQPGQQPDSKRRAARKPASERNLELAYTFFNEIGIISQLSSKQMQRAMPHGLTQSQFSVLNWFVRVDNQATPGRLANAFQVTKGAMTNTLGKLVQKNFIQISPDPDSGRSKIVRMTPAGRKARDQAIAATHVDLQEFLQHIPASTLTAALPLLREVRAYLDAARD
jgi:DNA-binding MarR family transcriptional regulator